MPCDGLDNKTRYHNNCKHTVKMYLPQLIVSCLFQALVVVCNDVYTFLEYSFVTARSQPVSRAIILI